MDLPRGDRVRVSSEGVARRSETARKTKREPHKAALSAVCPSTVGLRIDIPEGEGQDVGARRLLDVQHDIRVRERREAYCPVPVRAFGLRARRCRWRNVRREGDLAVVRRDRLCWARHVLRNTGLTRYNVSTVVHTLIGPFPSPAAFPLQVRPVLTDFVHVGVPMKWGLWAKAARENPTIRNSASNRAIPYFNGRMGNLLSKFNANKYSQRGRTRLTTTCTPKFLSKGDDSLHSEAPTQRGLRAVQPKAFSTKDPRGL